uniref:Ubiquitin-like domain-containing protein n=1 Tax=Chromera velia CCMP2878 TaxID=1169474 RepID=A0A0G4I5Z2_9ALVE|eukprot:Cvel_87.t1-p1 / transcript=Cvel_87.t1 / gene=Cvel_87 / organism=Chromera_velia_CCMP2878 / gene_product=Ubiquitin, putative / transcript_product=Ubiquitin, putative / location=Cvel_scaffold6:267594-268631(-) / protein_length=346 / sequence_SO=supercontig / SO=protein_coding / is_pseudo=false
MTPTDGSIEIFCKTLTGKCETIRVSSSDLVESLKKKVSDLTGQPVEDLKLVFAGKRLTDGQILESYGIEKEATIWQVLPCLRGGNSSFAALSDVTVPGLSDSHTDRLSTSPSTEAGTFRPEDKEPALLLTNVVPIELFPPIQALQASLRSALRSSPHGSVVQQRLVLPPSLQETTLLKLKSRLPERLSSRITPQTSLHAFLTAEKAQQHSPPTAQKDEVIVCSESEQDRAFSHQDAFLLSWEACLSFQGECEGGGFLLLGDSISDQQRTAAKSADDKKASRFLPHIPAKHPEKGQRSHGDILHSAETGTSPAAFPTISGWLWDSSVRHRPVPIQSGVRLGLSVFVE